MIAEDIISRQNDQVGIDLVIDFIEHLKHSFSWNVHILSVADLKNCKFSVGVKFKLFFIHLSVTPFVIQIYCFILSYQALFCKKKAVILTANEKFTFM